MMKLDKFREELNKLDWQDGLTREDLRSCLQQMPEETYLRLPAEKVFVSPDQVIHYVQMALQYKETTVTPPTGAEDIGGPRAWGESSTAHTVREERQHHGHGVGSGADSGNTGSGSTQTGADQAGTTYGEEYKGD